jgi:hypothetical protein
MAAGVTKLDRGLCAPRVNRIDEPREPRQKAIVVYAQFARTVAANLFRRGHPDRDQPHAANGTRAKVGYCCVRDVALVIG